MCFVYNSEKVTFSLYKINWLVLITHMESVYCAVRPGSLNKIDYVSSLKGVKERKKWNIATTATNRNNYVLPNFNP
jgi:hypothetical protein